MSLLHSPSITTNSLVLTLDMNNTQKSWKGKPVTNSFLIPTPDSSGNVVFGIQGTGTFQRLTTGTYGGYTIQPSDIVYKYVLGALGCHYHGYQMAVTSGQVYTFSFDFMISTDATGYPSTNYLANFECYETSSGTWVYSTGAAAADTTPTIIGVWKTVSFSLTIPTLTAPWLNLLLYPGACGNTTLANSGYILYKNPQVELSSFPSPFVQGTRSTTQSILDPIQLNTITANSLTYASNNTFSFTSASSNYITLPSIAATGNAPRSMFCWVNVTAGGCFISTGTASNSTAFNLVNYGSGYVGVMGFNNDFYPSSGTAIVNAGWKYIGATYDGAGTLTTYVNGVQDNISTGRSYSTTGQNNFAGRSNDAGTYAYITGSMPVVQIYNTSLTAAQVMQNFQALRGRYGV